VTPSTGSGQRSGRRRRTFGIAPYVPGRTMAEYIADGTLSAVEADDEVAAIRIYAASRGLTVTSDPLNSTGRKRIRVTLSDGREYVARYLRAAIAEFLPPELILEAPIAPRRPTPTEAADHDSAPAPEAAPEPGTPPPLPEPPEFVQPEAVSHADLVRLRPALVPRSWDIAAALWGIDGAEPRSVQVVAKRFDVSPGFVRIVAASVIRLASDDGSPTR